MRSAIAPQPRSFQWPCCLKNAFKRFTWYVEDQSIAVSFLTITGVPIRDLVSYGFPVTDKISLLDSSGHELFVGEHGYA